MNSIEFTTCLTSQKFQQNDKKYTQLYATDLMGLVGPQANLRIPPSPKTSQGS